MNNTLTRIVTLVLLYVLIPIGFTALYFVGNLPSLEYLLSPFNLSIIAGTLAYIFFMAQFLISARIRFLERIFGQDRLLSMHGYLGFTAGGLVLAHFVLKYILILQFGFLNFQVMLGGASFLIFAVLAPVAYFVLQGRKTKLGPIDYEKAKITHNLFALAGFLAVLHVFLATSTWSVMWPLVLRITILGWGVLTLGAYLWLKILRPRVDLPMEIAEVEELSPGVHRYRFAPIPGMEDLLTTTRVGKLLSNRRSGQFAYIRFEGEPPISDEHPFTFSSPAGSPMEMIVRGSGDYSALMPQIPLGTKVKMDGPYGRFYPIGLAPGTPLLFLAGGIGITPFLSMAKDSKLREQHPITLVWSIPGPEDEPVVRELQELDKTGDIQLKIMYTRRAPEGVETSRITGKTLEATLNAIKEKTSQKGSQTTIGCFLCGPGQFVRDMSKELRNNGIKPSQIHSESFSW
jgi:predicted ferric reductase